MRSEGKQRLLVEIGSTRSSEYMQLTEIRRNLIGRMMKAPVTSLKELKQQCCSMLWH